MRIAIISDIHGNLEALKTTLNDIRRRNVDKIICLGDIIAKGHHPKECLELIRKNCDIIIQGNCDKVFSTGIFYGEPTEIDKKRLQWNQSFLTESDKAFLSSLPFYYEFYMSGSLVRLFHATPVSDHTAVILQDNFETKYNMFLPSKFIVSDKIADIVIYGHIHHQYMDRLYNRTLINAGSVGNSFDVIRNPKKDANVLETTKAYYLIIEGKYGSTTYTDDISYQFIKLPYNIEKELEDVDKNLEKENYEFEIKNGMYRDMKKINTNFEKMGIDTSKI
ncbi:MAG: metallophosphoesterase family protein [Clostridia bacterium]|nr:metallophosphoesterase family protein [Clostridia bacterium]